MRAGPRVRAPRSLPQPPQVPAPVPCSLDHRTLCFPPSHATACTSPEHCTCTQRDDKAVWLSLHFPETHCL